MPALSAPFFHDERAAYAKLESILWPRGPVCPRCGSVDRITEVRGRTARIGLRRCGHCKRQFRVTVGTVFENGHVSLNLWLQVAHLLCSSKEGISSFQIHRILGVTYKTAWFMTHRLHEAMGEGKLPREEKYDRRDKRLSKGRGAAGHEAAFSPIENRA